MNQKKAKMLSSRKIAKIVSEIEISKNGFVNFDEYQEIVKKYKVLKIDQEKNHIIFSCINNTSNLPETVTINIYTSKLETPLSNGFKSLYENRPIAKIKQAMQKLIISEYMNRKEVSKK